MSVGVMHCALGRPFYGASKMAVTLGHKAEQSNQARIKVGFHFRHNKSSKTRSKQACGLFQRGRYSMQWNVKDYVFVCKYKHKRAMRDPETRRIQGDGLSQIKDYFSAV